MNKEQISNTSVEKEQTSNAPVGRIDKVEPAREFHASTGGKWIPILKSFNPFGPMAEAYAKTLAYNIEKKRLEVELTRIERQADIIENVIDSSFKLKMEELTHRRMALVGFYETVNAELQRLHIERVAVLEMAQLAQKKSFEEGLPIEERKMYKEMAVEITKELPRFGEKSNESLQKIIDALPPVEISPKLLEG